ncbi:MAG: hypothetical protein U0667_06275 [Chloroflexota bacterium]
MISSHLGRLRHIASITVIAAAVVVGGAVPTTAQSPSPASSPAATQAVDPSIPHDVPDLEALFPDAIDGTTLFKLSMGRPTLEALGDASLGDFDALVAALGIERGDLELAVANDPTSAAFNFLAFRAAGITGEQLVEAYETLVPQSEVDAVAQRIPVGDQEVVWVSMPNNPIPNLWFWAQGDTLVGIQAADQATFQRLYALLPPTVSASPAASPSAAL